MLKAILSVMLALPALAMGPASSEGMAAVSDPTASASRLQAGPVWSKPSLIARRTKGPSRPYSPVTRVAGDGSSVTVWSERRGALLRRRAANGRLGTIESISPRQHAGLVTGVESVAINDAGATVIIWRVRDNRSAVRRGRYVRLRSSDGKLAPVHQLDRETSMNSPQAEAFFGVTDGRARIVAGDFTEKGADAGYFLQAFAPEDGFVDRGPISQEIANEVDVAVDSEGNAVLVWEDNQFGGFSPELNDVRILATTLSRTGVLGRVHTIATADYCCTHPTPAVDVDANGGGHVIWSESLSRRSTERVRLQSRTISTAGTVGPTTLVAPQVSRNDSVGIASFTGGRSLAVWSVHEGRKAMNRFDRRLPERFPLRGRVLTPTGSGRAFDVAPKSDLSSTDPSVVAHGNRAVVLWRTAVPAPRTVEGFRLGFKTRFVTPEGPRGRTAMLRALPGGARTEFYRPAGLAIGRSGDVMAVWPEYRVAHREDRVYIAALR
jgi:hypothetical protein